MSKSFKLYSLVLVLILGVALGSTITTIPSSFAKKSGGLEQMASVPSDYPDNNPNAVEVHPFTAKKDSIGYYHVKGEIKNLGPEALQFVKVTGHFYDSNNQTVGVTSCCYTDPSDIEAGHTAAYDSFVQSDDMSGTPVSYRLSFDWG